MPEQAANRRTNRRQIAERLGIFAKVKFATPDAVRKALKARGLPYGIAKAGGTWYVHGGDAHAWYSSSLNVYRLDDMTVDAVVRQIMDMAEEHRRKNDP